VNAIANAAAALDGGSALEKVLTIPSQLPITEVNVREGQSRHRNVYG